MLAARDALRLDPNDPSAYLLLGRALQESGTLLEAVAAYEKSIELEPGQLHGLAYLGDAYLQLGRLEAAREILSHSSGVSLNDPKFQYSLAFTACLFPHSELRRIRALPQSQRMEILAPLLDFKGSVALVLADRAQLSRGDYLVILKRGLAKADASSIKFWLEATVCHLGWRKVFSILRDMAAPWPSPGASALYHVPFMFLKVYPLPPSLRQEFAQLLELYDRERPLPFLPDSWRQSVKTDRKFVFVWGGR